MGNLSLQRSPWKFFYLQTGPPDTCMFFFLCHHRFLSVLLLLPPPIAGAVPELHLQPLYMPTRRLRVFHRPTSSPLSSSPCATSLPLLSRTASTTGRGNLLLIHRRALVATPARNAASLLTLSIPSNPFQSSASPSACVPTAAAHLHCRRPLLHLELPLPTSLSLS
jgi:hypothetical protein